MQYQSSCGGVVQNVTTSGTVQTVSRLKPNCVYTFRVAAVGAGNKIGSFSNPVNASLPGECRRYILLEAVTSGLTFIVISVGQNFEGNM